MLDVAVTIMSISSLTLATDMIIYLINGKGMFPYAEDVKYMRYVYGILSCCYRRGIHYVFHQTVNLSGTEKQSKRRSSCHTSSLELQHSSYTHS